MALEPTGQADWGGGISRGRKAADGEVWDAINALIDDEGQLFKRGGSALLSTSDAADAPLGLADVLLAAGPRTIIWPGDPTAGFQVLDGSGAPVSPFTGSRMLALSRAVPVPSGMVVLVPHNGAFVLYYAGSLSTTDDAIGSVSVTNGSRTMTTTNSFANVRAGDLAQNFSGTLRTDPVESVDSTTQITLREPWPGATVTETFAFWRTIVLGQLPAEKILAVAYAGRRLLLMTKSRVYMSAPDDPFSFTPSTDYHSPEAPQLIGIQGMGNAAVVFGSNGVYLIDNLEFDIVDDAGNIQQSVTKLSSDLILWADSGIAAYAGSLVVPAIDDVWLFSLDGPPVPISATPDGGGGWREKIRPLYRSYVKAGYRPGLAAVHRGHYFLPIVNGTTLVDTLVCRLDRGAAWARWSGHAASIAYAQRTGETNRAAQLFGIAGSRVTDLSDCFEPSAANAKDADGSDFDCTIITRDFPTSGTNHPGTVVKARLRYELADDGDGGTAAPTVALAYSSDQDGGTFTALSNPILERAGTAGGGVSDGSKYSSWPVGKMRERIRFRITVSGAAASFVLRTLELLIRQGRLR